MPVFRKTTKRGARKHRNYTNKRRSRDQKYTGGRLDERNENNPVLHLPQNKTNPSFFDFPMNKFNPSFFDFPMNKTNPGFFRPQRDTRKLLRTKSLNDIPKPNSDSIWVGINQNISNMEGFDEKVNEFRKKMGNVKGKIVYGKFWMKGCIYCDNVKDTWDEVVRSLKKQRNYVNVDIVSENIEEGKKALKEQTGLRQDIKTDGFPQFYKIINKRLFLYNGPRNVDDMKKWLNLIR
jgi:thiol-disulfide isomerase/thioredoxin